jgi:P27 family predicted phage terminase small subunit
MTRRPGGGRKPKPTHLKLISGNLRKSRLNPREPQLEPLLPDPPAELIPEARVEWDRLAKRLLAAGILTVADGAVFAAYCQSYGRWQQTERIIADLGLTETTKHPLLDIARKAMADTVRFGAELGLSPLEIAGDVCSAT